jgi:hypothetical protein
LAELWQWAVVVVAVITVRLLMQDQQVDRAVEVVETLALVDLVVPVAKAMWVVPV